VNRGKEIADLFVKFGKAHGVTPVFANYIAELFDQCIESLNNETATALHVAHELSVKVQRFADTADSVAGMQDRIADAVVTRIANPWTACAVRLPHYGQVVWTSDDIAMAPAYWGEDQEWHFSNGDPIPTPTHWMPLPAFPRVPR
jgi:hypothetical protein